MEPEVAQKINESMIKMSGKPHQAYFLLKKKENKGWHTVAKIPANTATDIEDEIWRCDDSWGGEGEYRVQLFTNDDKRVDTFGDVRFFVGDAEDDRDDERYYPGMPGMPVQYHW